MKKSGILLSALIALAILCLLWFSSYSVSTVTAHNTPPVETRDFHALVEISESAGSDTSKTLLPTPLWLAQIEEFNPHLSNEQADAFLNEKGRSAENLLAAALATSEPGYLAEAWRQYPDHPGVLFLVAQYRDGAPFAPDDRTRALQALEASEPENGAVRHLRIVERLEADDLETATSLLRAATASGTSSASDWEDHSFDAQEALIAMYRHSGASPLTAQFLALTMRADADALGGLNTACMRQAIAHTENDRAINTGLAEALSDYTQEYSQYPKPGRFHPAELNQLEEEAQKHLSAADPQWAGVLQSTRERRAEIERTMETTDWLARHLDENEAAEFFKLQAANGTDEALDWLELTVAQRAGSPPPNVGNHSAPH